MKTLEIKKIIEKKTRDEPWFVTINPFASYFYDYVEHREYIVQMTEEEYFEYICWKGEKDACYSDSSSTKVTEADATNVTKKCSEIRIDEPALMVINDSIGFSFCTPTKNLMNEKEQKNEKWRG